MAAPNPIIHVVDDDDSLRTAIVRLLKAAGYEVRAYSSAGEFLLASSSSSPGCIILDVRMPGPSGLDLQAALDKQGNPLPIIFLSGHGDIPMSVQAIKAGAVDFLTKPVQRETLLAAVNTAIAQDATSRRSQSATTELQSRYESLTPRERAVFGLVVAGKLNKNVATELEISERTVKAHRARVMEKFQAASLAELVRIAEKLQASTPVL